VHVLWLFLQATAPAFNLPHLHLASLLGVTLFEFDQDFWLDYNVLIEHRLVTDGHRHRVIVYLVLS